MERRFRVLCLAFALVGFTLMMGCGSGQGPLSSDQGPAISEDAQISAQAPRAAKKAKTDDDASGSGAQHRVQSAQKTMSDGGGSLGIKLKKYGSKNDVIVKEAQFSVAPNSIVGGGQHEIAMEVHSGTTVDDVDVVFGPSGLTFDPPAELNLKLRGPATPADVQEALHIHGDGAYVETIGVESDKNGNSFLHILVKVPGFSRYSLGIGDR